RVFRRSPAPLVEVDLLVAVENLDGTGRAVARDIEHGLGGRNLGSRDDFGDLLIVEPEQLWRVGDALARADAHIGVEGDAVAHRGSSRLLAADLRIVARPLAPKPSDLSHPTFGQPVGNLKDAGDGHGRFLDARRTVRAPFPRMARGGPARS